MELHFGSSSSTPGVQEATRPAPHSVRSANYSLTTGSQPALSPFHIHGPRPAGPDQPITLLPLPSSPHTCRPPGVKSCPLNRSLTECQPRQQVSSESAHAPSPQLPPPRSSSRPLHSPLFLSFPRPRSQCNVALRHWPAAPKSAAAGLRSVSAAIQQRKQPVPLAPAAVAPLSAPPSDSSSPCPKFQSEARTC